MFDCMYFEMHAEKAVRFEQLSIKEGLSVREVEKRVKDYFTPPEETEAVTEVFEITDEGFAKVVVDTVEENKQEEVVEAKEGCPTSAIEDVE